jgi:hypothetical protein
MVSDHEGLSVGIFVAEDQERNPLLEQKKGKRIC